MTTILIVILVLLLLGAFPTWHGYGYGPSGIIGVVLVIFLILMLLGRI